MAEDEDGLGTGNGDGDGDGEPLIEKRGSESGWKKRFYVRARDPVSRQVVK